ncbi:uncharacterized protein METZ01_LOCUS339780, partial [marine metagenome]
MGRLIQNSNLKLLVPALSKASKT